MGMHAIIGGFGVELQNIQPLTTVRDAFGDDSSTFTYGWPAMLGVITQLHILLLL